jgi:hypothetical protein
MAGSQPATKDENAKDAIGTPITNNISQGFGVVETDNTYLAATWMTRFYRSVLFQMILFGAWVPQPLQSSSFTLAYKHALQPFVRWSSYE